VLPHTVLYLRHTYLCNFPSSLSLSRISRMGQRIISGLELLRFARLCCASWRIDSWLSASLDAAVRWPPRTSRRTAPGIGPSCVTMWGTRGGRRVLRNGRQWLMKWIQLTEKIRGKLCSTKKLRKVRTKVSAKLHGFAVYEFCIPQCDNDNRK